MNEDQSPISQPQSTGWYVGQEVRLVPDNPYLYNKLGTIKLLTQWGAYVYTEAAATKEFRAMYAEMVPLDVNGHTNTEQVEIPIQKPTDSTNLLNGQSQYVPIPHTKENQDKEDKMHNKLDYKYEQATHNKYNTPQAQSDIETVNDLTIEQIYERQTAKERGYTGDICSYCQGSKVVRNGACVKCMDCGESSGCS